MHIWREKSEYLEGNFVPQAVIRGKDDNTLSCYDAVWCCGVHTGDSPGWDGSTGDLVAYLKRFGAVHLANYGPMHDMGAVDYLRRLVDSVKTKRNRVLLHNQRQCWTDRILELQRQGEFSEGVEVDTLGYIYREDLIEDFRAKRFPGGDDDGYRRLALVGSPKDDTSSRRFVPAIMNAIKELQISRINAMPACRGVDLPSGDDCALVGEYGPDPSGLNVDVAGNRLGYDYLGSIFDVGGGCVPITSSLFRAELDRVGLSSPTLDYSLDGEAMADPERLKELHRDLRYSWDDLLDGYRGLVKEVKRGNKSMKLTFRP